MVALVTGATSGLGKSLCQLLASKNIPLIITGRNEEELTNLKQTLPVHVVSCKADLSKSEDRKRLIALIHEYTPDLVVNNAGFGLYGDALSHTTEEQMDILRVDGNAVLEITLEAARSLKMAGKPGTILNISSAAAFFVFPKFSVYSAVKGFVKQVSIALDEEMKPLGIRVLTACPGQIKTAFRIHASKGVYHKPSRYAMCLKSASEHLWHQIQTGKQVYIFDARYRVMILMSRLLPRSLVQKFLGNFVKESNDG